MDSSLSKKRVILALSCLAQFMVVLDIAIVNVALPSIKQTLGLRQSQLQWVVIAYSLVLGGFLLLGGRLGDTLGRRRIFLTGLTIFSIASLGSGLAQSAGVLIGARALQGFGAALLAPSALSILAVAFPEGRARNGALGMYGAVAGSSASVGVIASGLLTDGPGWRWIFFINVPIGAALLATAAKYLPADRVAPGPRHFDAAGAGAVTGGLIALVYALNRGVDHGWRSASTLAFFALAIVLLTAFIVVETRSQQPLVPGSLLKNRTRLAANLAAFCIFGGFFAFIFLGSLFMQQELHYSPTRTGIAWLATSVMAFVAAGITGARLSARVGLKRLLIAGTASMTLGAAWLTRVPAGALYVSDLLPAFLLAGIAIGLSAPAVQIGALSGVFDHEVGVASGLVETMREIGGAVGIAAVATALAAGGRDGRVIQSVAGFHWAFFVIVVLGGLGVAIAGIVLPHSVAVAARPDSDEPNAQLAGGEALA